MAEHVLIVAAFSSILFLIGSLVTKHKDRNHRIDDKLVEWMQYRIYHYLFPLGSYPCSIPMPPKKIP